MDSKCSESCSSIDSSGSTILALPSSVSSTRESNEGACDRDESMPSKKSRSPKDRILKLAAGGELRGIGGEGNN